MRMPQTTIALVGVGLVTLGAVMGVKLRRSSAMEQHDEICRHLTSSWSTLETRLSEAAAPVRLAPLVVDVVPPTRSDSQNYAQSTFWITSAPPRPESTDAAAPEPQAHLAIFCETQVDLLHSSVRVR